MVFLESFCLRPQKFLKRFSFGGGRVCCFLLCKRLLVLSHDPLGVHPMFQRLLEHSQLGMAPTSLCFSLWLRGRVRFQPRPPSRCSQFPIGAPEQCRRHLAQLVSSKVCREKSASSRSSRTPPHPHQITYRRLNFFRLRKAELDVDS